jgi:Acetyltransferase (GNAT) domain
VLEGCFDVAADKALRVSLLAAEEIDDWVAFVRASPSGGAYSLPAYLDALGAAVGGTRRIVVARRGASIAGGIAVLEWGVPLGRVVAPRLLLYYNGFVLRDYDTRYPSQRAARQNEVVAALAEYLVGQGYGRLELRSRSPLDDVRPLLSSGWTASPSYSYVVPIADLDLLWSRIEQNLRRLVERARGVGMTLVVDEDFDAFYDLHAATGDRKDAPVYLPRDAFRRFYETLAALGLCTLYHARDADGTVVASQLVLLGHPVTHTVSAAADPAGQSSGSNPFLRWSVFQDLAARGYEANDLTDASLGPVARFKSQLGGDLAVSFVARRPSTFTYSAQRVALGGARRARSLLRRPS